MSEFDSSHSHNPKRTRWEKVWRALACCSPEGVAAVNHADEIKSEPVPAAGYTQKRQSMGRLVLDEVGYQPTLADLRAIDAFTHESTDVMELLEQAPEVPRHEPRRLF